VTQQPYKLHLYAALLLCLSRRYPEEEAEVEAQVGEKRKADEGETVECGRDVIEDLQKSLKRWVEDREWINVRLCVSFAHVDEQR
jgi:nuclear cap-binding protein subunit 1